MAETAVDNNKARKQGPGPEPAPKAAPKGAASKLDLSTLAGIGMAVAGIIGGLLLENGSLQDILQGTAAMIVLGGTLGAVLITNPLPVVRRAIRGLGHVFFERTSSTSATIDALILYSAKAQERHREPGAGRRRDHGTVFAQSAQSGGGWHRPARDTEHDGNRYRLERTIGRSRGTGLGIGGRLRADHRDYRRGDGSHSGNETPGGHQGSRPRHCRGLRRHCVRSRPG